MPATRSRASTEQAEAVVHSEEAKKPIEVLDKDDVQEPDSEKPVAEESSIDSVEEVEEVLKKDEKNGNGTEVKENGGEADEAEVVDGDDALKESSKRKSEVGEGDAPDSTDEKTPKKAKIDVEETDGKEVATDAAEAKAEEAAAVEASA